MSNASIQTSVTVLTGYLGSGKTPLLNRILTEAHGKRGRGLPQGVLKQGFEACWA
jgi:hypothetical protein